MITIKATDKEVYWFCRGGKTHSGRIKPGQVVSFSEAKVYDSGSKEYIAEQIGQYADELSKERTGFTKTDKGVEYFDLDTYEPPAQEVESERST